MGKKRIIVGWAAGLILILNGFAAAWMVPDTGQMKCYDNSGEIPCPPPGEPFYGQDAQYAGPARSYTKLDGSGNALPDSAASWVMVKDNVTGLIWEVKQNKDGIQDYSNPHDADNTYTWYDSNPATNGGDAGTPGDGTDTEGFVNALNNANFGGYSDWRLPTVRELSSVMHADFSFPAVESNWFSNLRSDPYWSSATAAFYRGYAWAVNFESGATDYDSKESRWFTLAVRGGHNDPARLQDNGDGTVTDNSTGLMWQKETAPQIFTWQEALSHCVNLNLGDYTDWRLPDRNELQSLMDYSRFEPASDPLLDVDEEHNMYWSSTTSTYDGYSAWFLGFAYGHVYVLDKADSVHVRAVRNKEATSFGQLRVFIEPEGARDAGAGWRRTGTSLWRASGGMEYNVPPGQHTVEFKNITGWNRPANQDVTIRSGVTSNLTRMYSIADISSLRIAFSDIASPQLSDAPFAVTVRVTDSSRITQSWFSGEVRVEIRGGAELNRYSVFLKNGEWSGNLILSGAADSVKLWGYHGSVTGESNVFAVVSPSIFRFRLSGQVKLGERALLDPVRIEVRREGGTEEPLSVYSENGEYSFGDLEAGNYDLRVFHQYYKMAREESVTLSYYSLGVTFGATGETRFHRRRDLDVFDSRLPAVLLVPGMMGSTVQGWPLVPFLRGTYRELHTGLQLTDPVLFGVDIWTSLKRELASNGLQTIDVAYDWRKEIPKTAKDYFLECVKRVSTETGRKVHVVAHSMGGLVVRSYIQDLAPGENYGNEIDKLALVGSPSGGAIDAYFLWDGGDINNRTKFYEVARYIDHEVLENQYQSIRDTFIQIDEVPPVFFRQFIRDEMPAVGQLRPAFEYLYTNDPSQLGRHPEFESTVPNRLNDASIIAQRYAPGGTPDDSEQMGNRIRTRVFASARKKAWSSLEVRRNPSSLVYEYGEPVKKNDSDGDGTVLKESVDWGLAPFVDTYLHRDATHMGLMKAYAKDIAAFLLPQGASPLETAARYPQYVKLDSGSEPATCLSLSFMGRSQPYVEGPGGNAAGVNPDTEEMVESLPGSQVSIEEGSSGIMIPDPQDGTYLVKFLGDKGNLVQVLISLSFGEGIASRSLLALNHGDWSSFGLIVDKDESPNLRIIPSVGHPENVAAIRTNDRVLLTWSSPEDPGVTGYRIYGRQKGFKFFELLGSTAETEYGTGHNWAAKESELWDYVVVSVNDDGIESLVFQVVDNDTKTIARFQADVVEGVPPLTVSFSDRSTGEPDSWSWDFDGDGEIDSYEQNPSWTYTEAGNYSVILQVAGPAAADLALRTEYIQVVPHLSNAVRILKALSKIGVSGAWDATGDEIIDLRDAIHSLQVEAGLR